MLCIGLIAQRCQRLVDQIGTAQDTSNLTSQIQELQHTTNELVKTTNSQLKALAEIKSSSPVEKVSIKLEALSAGMQLVGEV